MAVNNSYNKKNTLPFSVSPHTLLDFIQGNNGEVITEIKNLISNNHENSLPKSNSIFVWGDKSVGKTFLLQSALAYARQYNKNAYYINGKTDNVIPPLEANGLLIIDNIDALEQQSQVELFDWCNELQKQKTKKSLLVSSRTSPSDLPLYNEIKTRLLSDFVVRLQPLSEDDKKQALINYAKRNGFQLSDTIANLFLWRLPRGMNDLASALKELDSFLILEKKPLTEYQVRQWLQNKESIQNDAPAVTQATQATKNDS